MSKRGKMKRISLISLLFITTSCGKSITEIFSAPESQQRAGVIASCATRAQAESLAESHQLSFRMINEKRKLVEFYGATKKELEKLLPQSKLRTNTVYEQQLISGDQFQAQSTNNNPYYGAHQRESRNSSHARYFNHLVQIDGFEVNHNQGQGVTIAVVDTGVYYNHPHLSPNIKLNTADAHGNIADNIDNDNNGFKDDYVGWDFYNGDAYPIDDNGHGTHVAGLAASTLSGIAPYAKILPVKVLSADGRGDLATIAAGILYAIDNGADIVNLSLGGPGAGTASSDLQSLLNSVTIAAQNDALIIAAAGNGGTDGVGDCNDQTPIYPANLNSNNVISVASVDDSNQLTSYSNFGKETVDIAAPGGSNFNGGLLSTGLPECFNECTQSNQPYENSTGTSMSTPLVAGLAAVIKSQNLSLTHTQIKDIILNGGSTFNELEPFTKSGKVINILSSIKSL
jgi:subtilisin family serine protease